MLEIKEYTMKLTKQKLREIIREEILSEKVDRRAIVKFGDIIQKLENCQ